MPGGTPGIGHIQTEAQLEAFVRDRLELELATAMRRGLYLRLATEGDRKVAFGVQAVTWNAGTPLSNPATVTHGLGTTPTTVLVSALDGLGPYVPIAAFGGATGTTFYVIANTGNNSNPGAGATTNISWLAIA